MLSDLCRMPDGTRIEADICLVGAGPAGIVLARELGTGRTRVVLIESGGTEIAPEHQTLNEGEAVGLPHLGLAEGRGRAFGGSAKLWAGQCLPFDDIDFEPRPWVPHSGWPFGPEELAPHYRRAEAFFRLGDVAYDETVFARFGLAAPGWSADELRTHFTAYTPQRDTGRHHMAALRRSAHVQVVMHATVTAIDTDADGTRVCGLRARSANGRNCTVQARVVVLCAGGLENARLLLASDHQAPGGLGNAHDLVGRFFQDHPNALAATLSGGDARTLQDRFRLLYAGRHRFFPKFALSPHRQRAARVLNANAHLVFEQAGSPGVQVMRDLLESARRRQLPSQPLRQALRLTKDAGSLLRVLRRRYLQGRSPDFAPTAIRLQCYLEQAPDPHSRITLGAERDSFGMRRLQLDWRLGALEHATLRTMVEAAQGEFLRLGLGRLDADDWVTEPSQRWKSHLSDSFHHAGTTRMADSPRDGVVDREAQVHGVAGLHVCGGSVFPTSGYANPTLTIAALAMRLADHLNRLAASPAAVVDSRAA